MRMQETVDVTCPIRSSPIPSLSLLLVFVTSAPFLWNVRRRKEEGRGERGEGRGERGERGEKEKEEVKGEREGQYRIDTDTYLSHSCFLL